MWRDHTFWAALAAALCFWAGLSLISSPSLDLTWPYVRPLAFLLPAVVYPILEEIVFRGAVQDFFHKRLRPMPLGPLSVANLATSLLFTAFHFLYHAPPWAIVVFIPSLIFGYFKDKYQRLLPPIVLHIFYNTGYYWLFGAT